MNTATFAFADNSYAHLPERFYSRTAPTPVSAPQLIKVNTELAESLGVNPHWLASEAGVAMIAGNALPASAEAIASAYAGHQFGGWNPQLGDGRAVLLGEILSPEGRRFDLQLKGSGPTPWSRGGDGRAPLGPVLREYIVSEAMAALGVPTTRALAAVSTGEPVYREQSQPGAILARVASSHIRVGTVQYFAARKDNEALALLADHVIDRHFPDAAQADHPYLALLQGIIAAQASLIAKWQLLGFVHGVMNTDNMLLCGETVDYGPCAFIDTFDANAVFSSIDHGGRYAYRNQPAIGQWNLANLAQCLLPLLDEDEGAAVALAQPAVDAFPPLFLDGHIAGMNAKLGFESVQEGDEQLAQELLTLMQDAGADFTLTFRHLADRVSASTAGEQSIAGLFQLPSSFDDWCERWQARLAQNSRSKEDTQNAMYRTNPVFIPRNHQVEAIIRAAVDEDNLQPFHRLLEVLRDPYRYRPDLATYALPPTPQQEVKQTFCGT